MRPQESESFANFETFTIMGVPADEAFERTVLIDPNIRESLIRRYLEETDQLPSVENVDAVLREFVIEWHIGITQMQIMPTPIADFEQWLKAGWVVSFSGSEKQIYQDHADRMISILSRVASKIWGFGS